MSVVDIKSLITIPDSNSTTIMAENGVPPVPTGLPAGYRPVRFTPPKTVICMDTETTGLDLLAGDRIISIGGVKMIDDQIVEAREWFINPDGKRIDEEAYRIHGISDAFLRNKPKFPDLVDEIEEFFSDYPLVIHHSAFDVPMIQNERKLSGRKAMKNPILDTLEFTRLAKDAGTSATLNKLLNDLGVNWIDREKHGSVKDALALAFGYAAFRAAALSMVPLIKPLPDADYPVRDIREDLYEFPQS